MRRLWDATLLEGGRDFFQDRDVINCGGHLEFFAVCNMHNVREYLPMEISAPNVACENLRLKGGDKFGV